MNAALRRGRKGLLRSARALDEVDGAFPSHAHAARLLLDMGILCGELDPELVAFSEGGLAVADEISKGSGREVSFAVVAELAPAWLGGPVFGAAAFDGTVVVDEALREVCSVSRGQFQTLVEAAYERVAEIVERSEEDGASFPDLAGRTAILVDDGLSGPMAVRAAITAVRNARAARVVLALPLGQRRSVMQLAELSELTYCASLRTARQGPLAAAYSNRQPMPCVPARPAVARSAGRRARAL